MPSGASRRHGKGRCAAGGKRATIKLMRTTTALAVAPRKSIKTRTLVPNAAWRVGRLSAGNVVALAIGGAPPIGFRTYSGGVAAVWTAVGETNKTVGRKPGAEGPGGGGWAGRAWVGCAG